MKKPNEEETPEYPKIEPLHSILLEQDPAFSEIIRQFISKLPGVIAAIDANYQRQDWPRLREAVHNLKGMGGGFGFPQLTEQSAELEKLFTQGDFARIAPVITELQTLSERIQAGLPD